MLQFTRSLFILTVLILINTFWIPTPIQILGQQPSPQNFVTYEKRSDFIKEFKVPINERGLKGIVTDNEQNVWFYHATTNLAAAFDTVQLKVIINTRKIFILIKNNFIHPVKNIFAILFTRSVPVFKHT
ncbi:MAG TPA: hypothetical protein VJS91_08425 [Nitrososphaeraceae archaeon]|nr:hypothetical protein [Nitrososphaeraceae archaeon]